ncbi:MAG: 4Fe-4S dicluster domain-containing protein [Erysipelotrichaceae bacterium]|nr:4Fe-4S dicluster domain-containing protein [Erysipelotrichaceae bacterium]
MNNNKFETRIQYLKYQVLKEVAKEAWEGDLVENVLDIPKKIIPGKTPSMRCCVYKERAILQERVKLAMGGKRSNPGIIEVIDIACDECPMGGYEVTNSCRGCLAQRCYNACPRDAIYFDNNHQAHINKEKCVNCGACSKACQYSAIENRKRPCENVCPVKAIEANEDQAAKINTDKCINCGACISQCPFGAIMDKSFILDAIDYMQKSDDNKNFKVYALIAPAIADSFREYSLGQVVTGLKKMGFYDVIEVAKGADMVAYSEAKELDEKGFLLSSCCPAFVAFTEKNFPDLKQFISHNLSPMGAIAKKLKEDDPECKLVFIGPCTAKKAEIMKDSVKEYVDVALTFEELLALFDAKEIELAELEETDLSQASYYGRIFARSGGLTEAMAQGLKELNSSLELKPETCNGIDMCRVALLKKSKSLLQANFVEGMVCTGGCIGGAGTLQKFGVKKDNVDNYAKKTTKESITQSVKEQ